MKITEKTERVLWIPLAAVTDTPERSLSPFIPLSHSFPYLVSIAPLPFGFSHAEIRRLPDVKHPHVEPCRVGHFVKSPAVCLPFPKFSNR